jgi:transcriptional regulator with XRE-family HTH domain
MVVMKVTSSGRLALEAGRLPLWGASDSRPGRGAVVVGKPFAHRANALANPRSRAYGERGITDAERLMDQGRQAAPSLEVTGRRLGAIVRSARMAQGLTLAELGERTGYSAAQVSRYERGIAQLTDIAVLRRFAGALAIAPQTFGLATAPVPAGQRPQATTSGSTSPVTDAEGDGRDGEHPARRRLRPADPAATAGPAVTSQPGSGLVTGHGPAESVRPYADRGLVTRQQWNGIIRGAAGEVWLYGMAEFGYATDDDVPGILAGATSRGCQVRILLLNPASPGTTAIDGDEGSPPGTLAARTRAALARFTVMRQACGKRMQVRVYDGHPTVSVVRGDNRMLVTPYLRFFIGSNSPTFEFRSDQAPKMFTRYARHFENTWNLAEDWTR